MNTSLSDLRLLLSVVSYDGPFPNSYMAMEKAASEASRGNSYSAEKWLEIAAILEARGH